MFLQVSNILQYAIANTLVQSMSSGVLRLLQSLKALASEVSAGISVGSVTLLRLLQSRKASLIEVSAGNSVGSVTLLRLLQPPKVLSSLTTFGR